MNIFGIISISINEISNICKYINLKNMMFIFGNLEIDNL